MDKSEFYAIVTITGFKNYIIRDRIAEGTIVFLQKEPGNIHDDFAIAVYTNGGKIGYVADSEKTVHKNTMSAKQLYEVMENTAQAEIIEFTSYDAVCRVNGVFNMDKLILRAFEYYNAFEFEKAFELFVCVGEKYNSVLLIQYTADCLIKLQRYKEALPYIETALKQEKTNNISLMMYGSVNEELKNYGMAIKCYSEILKTTANEEVEKALKRCKQEVK